MLTVLFAESADNLAHLVRFYAPTAQTLLDVTFGAGTLTKKSPVPVIGVDKDPTSSAKYTADATTDLTTLFPEPCFDVAVFDPPYLYGSKAMHMGPVGDKTWSGERTTWKDPLELRETARGVAQQLHQVLLPSGLVIVKIADARFKKRLVRNAQVVADAFETYGFYLHDQIIYVRTMINSYGNAVSANGAHGYFLIFKKGDGK